MLQHVAEILSPSESTCTAQNVHIWSCNIFACAYTHWSAIYDWMCTYYNSIESCSAAASSSGWWLMAAALHLSIAASNSKLAAFKNNKQKCAHTRGPTHVHIHTNTYRVVMGLGHRNHWNDPASEFLSTHWWSQHPACQRCFYQPLRKCHPSQRLSTPPVETPTL